MFKKNKIQYFSVIYHLFKIYRFKEIAKNPIHQSTIDIYIYILNKKKTVLFGR